MINESNRGQFSFSKGERLKNKKIIDHIFKSGKKLSLFPFDFRYLRKENDSINEVLISVSKSKINSSVKRNLLKRRIRESYRLNKSLINGHGYYMAFIYSTSKILSYKQIEISVISLFNTLNNNNE
tara:strand:- start:1065 stop:1442 length:378 start_codon:yes stop_codon:yes gene_type:complete